MTTTLDQTSEDRVADLEAQITALRKQLLEARRAQGGQRVENFALTDPDGRATTLAELFGDKQDLIVVHNMGRACVYCTLWADGINGVAEHLADRAGFVLCSPDEPAVLREFASSRGWRFPTVSARGSAFTAAMGFEHKPGEYWPGVSTFHRDQRGAIERIARATFGPGDDYCALWHLFDLLRDGPADWAPKYSYASHGCGHGCGCSH